MNQPETLHLLRQFQPMDAEETGYLARTIAFVEQTDCFWQRSTLEGHLTGSAWIVSEDGGSALLLHHRKLDRWLQPGGHADAADDTLLETARREAMEECGISELKPTTARIFDVDVHEIPARGHEPAHFHYDLRFLFSVPKTSNIERNLLETKALAWLDLDTLCSPDTPNSIRRMALKTRKVQSEAERF